MFLADKPTTKSTRRMGIVLTNPTSSSHYVLLAVKLAEQAINMLNMSERTGTPRLPDGLGATWQPITVKV
jgi:hypothetical protein